MINLLGSSVAAPCGPARPRASAVPPCRSRAAGRAAGHRAALPRIQPHTTAQCRAPGPLRAANEQQQQQAEDGLEDEEAEEWEEDEEYEFEEDGEEEEEEEEAEVASTSAPDQVRLGPLCTCVHAKNCGAVRAPTTRAAALLRRATSSWRWV